MENFYARDWILEICQKQLTSKRFFTNLSDVN